MIKEYVIPPTVMLAGAGLVAGLGQLLASDEKLTVRIVVGRALSSLALGASAGVVLVWFPDMPLEASLGFASLFASLGTSALERVMQKFLGKGK